MKVHVSNLHSSIENISEREIAGLGYTAGYIVRECIRFKMNLKIQLQQTISITAACRKAQHSGNQKLDNALSGGGLAFIKPWFEKVLAVAEKYIRHEIDISHLQQKNCFI